MPGILRARRGARRATLALPAPSKPAGAWPREFGRQPCPPREGRAMAPVSGTSRSRCCFRPDRPERRSEPSDPDRVCEVVPRVTHTGMSLIARPGAGARIGVIRSRAAASTRSCSSRSGAAARRYGRWARPNRYARDARYARHAWTGRWTAARRRGCGEAPARTSGALCGLGGCIRPASALVRPPRAAPDDPVLEALGIDYGDVTDTFESNGLAAFDASWRELGDQLSTALRRRPGGEESAE